LIIGVTQGGGYYQLDLIVYQHPLFSINSNLKT